MAKWATSRNCLWENNNNQERFGVPSRTRVRTAKEEHYSGMPNERYVCSKMVASRRGRRGPRVWYLEGL
ncbi:hypothetical protein BM1_10933 [Bipolaris maydis]|nr:hypothetical protein BM1_10933 [Bipolaris maydis]